MPPLKGFEKFTKAPDDAQVRNKEFRAFVEQHSGTLNPVLFNINFYNEFMLVLGGKYITMDIDELIILSQIIDRRKPSINSLKDFIYTHFPNYLNILSNESQTIERFIREVQAMAERHHLPGKITRTPQQVEH